MSVDQDKVEYYAPGAPTDLPSRNTIAQHCASAQAGYSQNGISFEVGGIPRFWIKYGFVRGITLGEALTQDQVAKIVNADPASASVVRVPEVYLVFLRHVCRYIVMQHVAGDTVESRWLSTGKSYREGASDLAGVVAAVKRLISICVPSDTRPGHVGGGPIGHSIFYECMSSCEYPTVHHLEAQINNVCF